MRSRLPTLALLTLGCASTATLEPSELIDAPAAWASATAPGAVQSEWWRSFGDPALERLVEQVLARNFDLQAAAARVKAAEAQARIAGADLAPQLNAGLNGQRSRQNFIGLPIPGAPSDVLSTTTTSYGLSLNLGWEVDLWGRLDAAEQAAVAELQATQADLAGARLSLVAQTAKLWFQLAEAKEQAALAAEVAESFTVTEELLRERYEIGVGSAQAVRQASGLTAAARAAEAGRRQQVDSLRRQLEVLAGRYPEGDLAGRAELPDVTGEVPAGLPVELLTRRPDLQAAERRLLAGDARLREAEASLYPRVSLTGSAGSSSTELDDLLDWDFRVWSLAAGITAPLFQGGRLRANVDRAEAGREELTAFFVGTVLQAFAEVETGLSAERWLARRVAQLEQAVEDANLATELAEERYLAGTLDGIRLLDQQRDSFRARSEELDARRERLLARIDLHLALGGGFADAATPQEP